MDTLLTDIAKKLAEIAKKREALADALKQTDKSQVTKFKHKIRDEKLDCLKICGVDGGFLKKEYHGAGLILRRAVAACFEYEKGKLKTPAYLPSHKPIPDSQVIGPEFSESEFNLFANLKREEIELQTCLLAIDKFKPDILIRDGSIVPYPSNIPEKSSPVYKIYLRVIDLFKELYQICEENKILLCGAVEDSRGKRFCNLISDEAIPPLLDSQISDDLKKQIMQSVGILDNTTDTLFLYYLLDVGERTSAVDYSRSSELPILKDLESYAKKIFALYIKAVEFDRPLRIDFLSNPDDLQETSDKIASIIYTISKQNRTYAYPNVLIEADARAKLTEVEIEHFKAAINEKLGQNPALFELRRELRPF
ncbi:MAG: DNA double-strand break repair nuclease NurA [Candidatus Nanoarchaeia archaeon]